ncbi:MAG: PIN domain-containing protein [Candidatus Promineifilaceae bacterium]|nr:PIN domain-containing protein [Candidatus Promineifilaceae bacterium]
MDAQIKVLIDLNVILDVLQQRQPHYEDSALLLAHAESQIIKGTVAAHSWTTLFYLYAKDQSAELARVRLTDLLQFLSVAPVDQSTIEQALNLPYRDFEDAVQMIAAVKAGAKYLVTRNVKDYKAGPLRVLRPSELLALLAN